MNTVETFTKKKSAKEKISMLTSYDFLMTKLIDKSVDAILVGDSLGMVMLGYEDTTRVSMEDMIHHIKAVSRGVEKSLLVGDMPFLSYHLGIKDSVLNAGRLVREGGCKAVKLEGGEEIKEHIKAIISAGIPVMGHLGYTPQSVNVFGGHKAQGRTIETAKKIIEDALILEESGVFAIVLECIPYDLADHISKQLKIPTIGIGSGSKCDGQILVTHDMLGLDEDFNPRHVKKYTNLSDIINKAILKYVNEVKHEDFPKEQNSYAMDGFNIEDLFYEES
ncbi:MAG: 3-methyl-2-oxobutanoate hydroxymethyltransferase [Clostridiales bacterium]